MITTLVVGIVRTRKVFYFDLYILNQNPVHCRRSVTWQLIASQLLLLRLYFDQLVVVAFCLVSEVRSHR